MLNAFPWRFSLQPSHPTPMAVMLWPPIFVPAVRCPLSHAVSAGCFTGHDYGVARLNAITERQYLV